MYRLVFVSSLLNHLTLIQDEELTPEAVTMEQFLAGSIENKPKTVQKFLDLGGNVNSIDEVRAFW